MRRPRLRELRNFAVVRFTSMEFSVFWTWLDPWKGLSLPRWYRGWFKHEPDRDHPRRILIMPKRPEGAQGVNGAQVLNASLGTWSKLYPTLAEWLCVRSYDDGQVVGDVRLITRCVQGIILTELKVQDGPLRIVGKERSPDLSLAALELLLRADPVPWEFDEYPVGKRQEKKKGK